MCSYTFTEIHKDADLVWMNQRYHLVKDYQSKPFLVPPFNLLALAFYLCRHYMCPKTKCCRPDFTKFGFR